MERQIIVNQVPGEKRIAILEDRKLVEFLIIRNSTSNCLGNIYRGIVRRVIPGMQSAFIDFGHERTGFIYIKDLKKDISYEEFEKTLDDDDAVEEEEKQPAAPVSITDYIRDGQHIIVQVMKEPIGQKGARLTSHATLTGRFCVLMPTIAHTGVSKKITDQEKRHELQALAKKTLEKGFGIILRTMAGEAPIAIVEREIVMLIKRWQDIETRFKKEKGEGVLLFESDPLIEEIKNTYSDNLAAVVCDNQDDYNTALNYVQTYIPDRKDVVKLHDLPYSIFDYYSIEAEIEKTLKKKIWLRSGGFLYIEQTEALTVIDVNTGKYLGKESLEQTVLKTNLEAVEEITYHIRLRNIGGIIIVDFIDMKRHQNRMKVIRALETALESDPARTSVYHFTRLGLIQITRKRTLESNIQTLTELCPYCSGNGLIKSRETVTFEIFREIERQNRLYNIKRIKVEAHPDIIFCVQQRHDAELNELVRRLKIDVVFSGNGSMHREQFVVTEHAVR